MSDENPKGRFEIRKASDGRFYTALVCMANGEDLVTSQMFTRKENAKNNIDSVVECAADSEVVDLT